MIHDLGIIKGLMEDGESLPPFAADFTPPGLKQSEYDHDTALCVSALGGRMAGAKTPEEMEGCLGAFFKERGAGKYALYRAFRLSGEGEEMRVSPIRGRIDVKLSDLVG